MKFKLFCTVSAILFWGVFIAQAPAVEVYSQIFSKDPAGLDGIASGTDYIGSVLAQGDFNKDGYMDLAIGVPSENFSGDLFSSGTDTGAVYILYGTPAGLSSSAGQVWNQGNTQGNPESYDRYGTDLASGDFNGDGYDDLAIGVPEEDYEVLSPLIVKENAGVVHVLYGGLNGLSAGVGQIWSQSDSGISGNPELGDRYGTSLAAGDFNGDGCDDLAIGVPTEDVSEDNDGCVNVLYGNHLAGLSTAGQQLWHQGLSSISGKAEAGDRFGQSLAAGDYNGDGCDDLAIGVPTENFNTTDDGVIHILFGRTSGGLSATGNRLISQDNIPAEDSASGDRFGDTMLSGDLNNDGYSDLIVGVPMENSGKGVVHILFGPAFDTLTLHRGDETGGQFGRSLACGDFDGDGSIDLMAGAPFEDVQSKEGGLISDAGAVYIFHNTGIGFSAVDITRLTQDSLPCDSGASAADDRFGSFLSSGDFNGDRVADLAIGVPRKEHLDKDNIETVDVGAVIALCSKPPMQGHNDMDTDGDIDGLDLYILAKSGSISDFSGLAENFATVYSGSLLCITEAEKLSLIERYAPRVWLHNQEPYKPSSVEWAFNGLTRFLHEGEYWLRTTETLSSPSSVIPLFYGPADSPGSAPVYAFWARKTVEARDIACNSYEIEGFFDLIYFFYYPYNRGKNIDSINTTFGHHVGDWEHITVRLMARHDPDAGWILEPFQVHVGAHNFGGIYRWEDERLEKWEDTHPVVYAAWGSHGLWIAPGEHRYMTILIDDPLIDSCNQGTAWDTWTRMEIFSYDRPSQNTGHGLGGSIWPRWMSNDFSNPGDCGHPASPACGPIYRWGNPKEGEVFSEYRLTDGPSGPVSKSVWLMNLQ